MSAEHDFNQMYKEGSTPWDLGKPDFNLIKTVTAMQISPCKALDVGCGTGDNAIWLSQQGFHVIGIDTSEAAIGKAKQKASAARVKCSFVVADILRSHVEGAPFGFVFDRGCFHTLASDDERHSFARQAADHLEEGGLWLSLVGNADEQRTGQGPPQRTAREIVTAVENDFEILSLVAGHFGSNRPDPARAWICLMRKRKSGE